VGITILEARCRPSRERVSPIRRKVGGASCALRFYAAPLSRCSPLRLTSDALRFGGAQTSKTGWMNSEVLDEFLG
jgi:hypothetical protein